MDTIMKSIMKCALLTALALLLIPAAAQASTVTLQGGVLTYDAANGEVGDVEASVEYVAEYYGEEGIEAPFYLVVDYYANTLTPGAGCLRFIKVNKAYCPVAAATDVTSLVVDRRGAGRGGFANGTDLPATLYGSEYVDELSGGTVSDTMYGNGGSDTLIGGEGNDTAYGGSGNDSIRGGWGDGDDNLHGGSGNDFIDGDTVCPDPASCSIVSTATGDDTIYGDSGADELLGNGGSDTVKGGDGYDSIDVRRDGRIDAVDCGGGTDETYVDLLDTRTGCDSITLVGSSASDTILGASGADSLSGGGGNDTIKSGRGNDTLRGGAGNDKLYGSYGNDKLYARDTQRDYVYCGPGTRDIAYVDSRDRTYGCETVRRG